MSGSATPVTAPSPPASTTWGAIYISTLVFAAYFVWTYLAATYKLTDLYGPLVDLPKAGGMLVIGYYLGSSKGSADKSAASPPGPSAAPAPIVPAPAPAPAPVAPPPA